MYKLPKGMKILRDNEYPKGYNIEEVDRKRDIANNIEGYTLKLETGRKWDFSACININIDNFWNVFCELCNSIFVRNKARGMIGYKATETVIGKELDINEIISIFFNEYRYVLLNNGYIEFGIADFRKATFFCEIFFINNFKTIFIWSNELDTFINIMNNSNLTEIEDLQFINELSVVSKALKEDFRFHYTQVIDNIKQKLM